MSGPEAVCLRVEGVMGKKNSEIAWYLCDVATRFKLPVVCNVNGVDMHARPHDDYDDVLKQWLQLREQIGPVNT